MSESTTRIGPLEVTLPNFVQCPRVGTTGPYSFMESVIAPGAIFGLRFREGNVAHGRALVQNEIKRMRPKRVEPLSRTIGGFALEGVTMIEPSATALGSAHGGTHTCLVGDLFGDMFWVHWGFTSQVTIDQSKLTLLYEGLIQEIVIRRGNSIDPGVMRAWIESRSREGIASEKKSWWRFWGSS